MAKNLEKQMEMFEDGGLLQEGGSVDEVSGNEVPPGSLKEEVRDDIPAQLSEGEFVFPADVVRYYGLETLMEMRQRAKAGLARMEEMGQMGNADEATLPDDIPFTLEDLDIEEEDEYNYQVGGYVPGQYSGQGYGTYTLPGTGVMQQQPSYLSTYGQQVSQQQPIDYGIYSVPSQQQFRPATYTPEPYTGPRFEDVIPTPTGAYDELRRYVNAQGQVRMIPFVDGKPLYPIPQGFYPQEEEIAEVMPSTIVGQTGVVETREGADERPVIGGRTQQEIQSGLSEMKDRYSITGSRGMDILGLLPGGNIIKNIFGAEGPRVGVKEPQKLLEQGPPPFAAAIDRRRAEFERVLGTDITGYVGYEKGDLDPVTGGVFDARGRAVNEDGSGAVGSTGTRSYDSLKSFKDDLAAGKESGWRGGPINKDKYDSLSAVGKANYDKYAEITGAKSHKATPTPKPEPKPEPAPSAPTASEQREADAAAAAAQAAAGRQREAIEAEARRQAEAERRQREREQRQRERGDTGDRQDRSSPSSGSSCFAAGTKFIMEDETTKNIEDIKIGDKLKLGGRVYSTIQGDGLIETWYNYGTTKVTGNHAIFENGEWKRVKDAEEAIPALHKEEILYTLINENHRMVAEDGVVYTDYDEVDNTGIEEDLLIQLNGQNAEATAA